MTAASILAEVTDILPRAEVTTVGEMFNGVNDLFWCESAAVTPNDR